jgi:hypothetical protein
MADAFLFHEDEKNKPLKKSGRSLNTSEDDPTSCERGGGVNYMA